MRLTLIRRPGADAARLAPMAGYRYGSAATRTAGESNKMAGLRYLILTIIDLYWWVIIVQAVMSWLVAFGVINTYNKFVAQVGETLYRLTEPALRPIRNFLPNLGGIDISPIILLLFLGFLRMEIYEYFPV
jgi:YggT family protein